MIFLVFSSHISIGLWLGSLEIMDKKLVFVQQRPYDNMEDSFVTILEKYVLACFLIWHLAECKGDRECVKGASLEKLSVEVLLRLGAAVIS